METFSVLLAICAGNSPVSGDFPTQRPVTRSFDVLFDLRPNKRLSKLSWGWWFETPSHPLWRHQSCSAPKTTWWLTTPCIHSSRFSKSISRELCRIITFIPTIPIFSITFPYTYKWNKDEATKRIWSSLSYNGNFARKPFHFGIQIRVTSHNHRGVSNQLNLCLC